MIHVGGTYVKEPGVVSWDWCKCQINVFFLQMLHMDKLISEGRDRKLLHKNTSTCRDVIKGLMMIEGITEEANLHIFNKGYALFPIICCIFLFEECMGWLKY